MNQPLLFDYFRSTASYRVRIALNLKGVSYSAVPTSLLDGANKADEYLARNPQGFVPMLSIDGHDLTQSLAIIDYLDNKYPEPGILPTDPAERAQVLAQALVIIADIHPVNNLRILKYLKGEMEQEQERGRHLVSALDHRRLCCARSYCSRSGPVWRCAGKSWRMCASSRKCITLAVLIRRWSNFPSCCGLMRH